MNYEFGFGEDIDFGMQLRNNGIDIIYLPYPEIIHIKAPMEVSDPRLIIHGIMMFYNQNHHLQLC